MEYKRKSEEANAFKAKCAKINDISMNLNNITHDPFRTPMPGVTHRSFVTSTPYHQVRQGPDDNSIATMQTSIISNQTDTSASFSAAGILLAPTDNSGDVSNLVRMTSTMCAYVPSTEQSDLPLRSGSKVLSDDQRMDTSNNPPQYDQKQTCPSRRPYSVPFKAASNNHTEIVPTKDESSEPGRFKHSQIKTPATKKTKLDIMSKTQPLPLKNL